MTPEQRHRNMAAIRSVNTKPELLVRRHLWKLGFRYSLNSGRLPGHPDIVLRKYRTCIFVNGCFWHGHDGCRYFRIPKSNVDYWTRKIARNKERDREELRQLEEMGWHCITVWECDLRKDRLEATLESLVLELRRIYLQDHGGDGPAAEKEPQADGPETSNGLDQADEHPVDARPSAPKGCQKSITNTSSANL